MRLVKSEIVAGFPSVAVRVTGRVKWPVMRSAWVEMVATRFWLTSCLKVLYGISVWLPELLPKRGATITLPKMAIPSNMIHIREIRIPPCGRFCWGVLLGRLGPRRLSMDMLGCAPLAFESEWLASQAPTVFEFTQAPGMSKLCEKGRRLQSIYT